MDSDDILSVEFFAAKDRFGMMMMAVPCRCGLKQADTLLIDGSLMVAMCKQSILPIDLPPLSEASKEKILAFAKRGKPLPVGEFKAGGLFDSYFLNVVIS